MGRAILRGVVIGLPFGIVGMTVAVRLITGLDMFDSFATAIIPGVFLGAFAGGFVGLTKTMVE
jgi:ABC-type Mn2+/Zn2+ transport system permease subunit